MSHQRQRRPVNDKSKLQKRRLVQETAEKLREIILAREPDAQIGSLNEVAQLLGVGIVTVQQAARILEHEGLLTVKRGPGGGYYGARPDEAALERAFASYMRVHGFGHRDTLDMMALLDSEIIPSATRASEDMLQANIAPLLERLDHCNTPEARVAFESDFRDALFTVVKSPLIELLSRVTTQLYITQTPPVLFADEASVQAWTAGRRRILLAILARDEELARFEADRFRRMVRARRGRAGAS